MPFRIFSPAAVLFSVALLGCEGLAPRGDAQAAPPPGWQSEPRAPSFDTPAPAPVRATPNGAAVARGGLTPDLMYALLVGDIAAQREQYPLAYEHYLEAARASRDARVAELATQAALGMEDTGRAEGAVHLWLELAPRSLTAHQVAALLAIDTGKTSEARTHLRKLVELAGKRDGDGYLDAARLLVRVKDPQERLRLMAELRDTKPKKAEAQFAYAIVAASAGDNQGAEQAARRAISLRPRWSEAQMFLVRVLLAGGRKTEASKTLAGFLKESPDDLALRTAYARLLVEQESYAEAKREFKRLLRARPGDPVLLLALGVLAMETKDAAGARGYFEQLLATGKRPDDALFYLGQLAEQEQRREAAIAHYSQIRSEHLVDAQIRMARLYAEGGEINRSREIIGQLRGQATEQAAGLYLIEAEILREVKRPEEALQVYDEALRAHPDDSDLLYARALHGAQMKRVDILERDLKRILAKEPDHANALNALGYTLADQTDRYQEALGLLERAIALKPDDPAVLDSMGWLQHRLGNNSEALRYLRRAAQLLQDPEIAAHLGAVLWDEGRRDEARQVWGEALVRDPDSDYLRETIDRYQGRGP